MAQELIGDWVTKAKDKNAVANASDGVNVVRRGNKKTLPKSKGEMILEVSEKIFPALMKLFSGVKGEDGILLQPSHVRGMALNVAAEFIKRKA